MIRQLFVMLSIFSIPLLKTSVAFGFPIFAPATAYINCKQTTGFFGDSADVALGFAGGTKTNVTWDAANSKLALSAGQTSGTFVSRVIDNSCIQLTPFLSFSWTTSLPFHKPMTVTSEATTAYPSLPNSTLMTGLQGLYRFEETSYNGTAGEVKDSSSNARHGTLSNTASITNTTGLFGKGLAGNGAGYIAVPNTSAQTETATHSYWYKTSDTGAWKGHGGRKNTNASGYGWIIRQNDVGGAYIDISTSAGDQGECFNAVNVVNGAWHHIVAVFNNGAAALWVDGNKVTCAYLRGTGFATGLPFLLLAENTGTVDEVAFWNRALSDAEIQSLYRRGGNRVKIQVRNCTDSTCSTNPTWRGPDNTAATFFTEVNNNSVPATGTGTVLTTAPQFLFSSFPSITMTSRYFQYKIVLETSNTTYLPDVKTIGPSR